MQSGTPRSIYGIGLASNVRLEALDHLEPAANTDIRLVVGEMPPVDGIDRVPQGIFYTSEDSDEQGIPSVVASCSPTGHYRIDYADGTKVVIDAAATTVWATAPPKATIEDTATYLLGPVLGIALHLRGVTCLHASAVDVAGRAVAFVGAAGAGKSTLAAAFARSGHAVLTDDVAPLTDHGDRFEIQPAYPRVRLWPDSVEMLFGGREALPRLTPTWDKRYLALTDVRHRFAPRPLPLAALLILGERETPEPPRLRTLPPRHALVHLVRHSYAARLLSSRERAREFEVMSRLAAHVPVHALDGYGDVARMDALRDLVQRHVSSAIAG